VTENAYPFKGAVIAVSMAVVAPLLLMVRSAVFHPGGSDLSIGVLAFAMPFCLPIAALVGWFLGKQWPQR
jgi:hypothetical protein